MAHFEMVKSEYPVRQLLQGNTLVSTTMSLGQMNTRKITMQSSGVRLFASSSEVSLEGAREIENEAILLDELMTQRANRELHDRRV